MLISQLMGRLARANRGNKTSRIRARGTSERDQHTGKFSSALFYSILLRRSFKKVFKISAFKTRCLLLSLLVKSCTGNDSLLTHFAPPQYG